MVVTEDGNDGVMHDVSVPLDVMESVAEEKRDGVAVGEAVGDVVVDAVVLADRMELGVLVINVEGVIVGDPRPVAVGEQ